MTLSHDATRPPLTSAERQKRYRERKAREAAERRELAGLSPGGEFTPRFEGQRPPFQAGNVPVNAFEPGSVPKNAFPPGNALSVTHGATSPDRFGPLGEAILAEFSGSAYFPDYLRDPSWSYALTAWSQAEARCLLVRRWLDSRDVEAALSEITEMTEDEDRPAPGQMQRRTWARKIEAGIRTLDTLERAAMRHREQLGLTPLARARLGKDIAAMAKFDLAAYWADQGEPEDEVPAAGPGGDGRGAPGAAAAAS